MDIALRDLARRTWYRRKIAILITLVLVVIEALVFTTQRDYLASGVLTIGAYCESVNYPTFRPVEHSDNLELYVNKSLLTSTGLDRQCLAKGTVSSDPILQVTCWDNSAAGAQEKLSTVMTAIEKRHQEFFAVEKQYANHAATQLDERMKQLARRIHNLPQKPETKTTVGLVTLLQYKASLEEQYRSLENDSKLNVMRRQLHRHSHIDPATLKTEHRTIGPKKLIAGLLIAILFGVLAAVSLALGEALRDAGMRPSE